MEFERARTRHIEEGTKKPVHREYPRFVSDRERAHRIEGDKINPNEIVAGKGMFNAIDGTTHSSEAVADLASERYLLGREGDLNVYPADGASFKGIDGHDYQTEAETRVADERYLDSQSNRSSRR